MHRAILEACLPWFLWLVAAVAALWILGRLSGARFTPARLRTLHRCEEGSVQTLSFVLTLPLFMLLVLLIVQISQVMIGVGVVNYAAYAAARAASVWIPADVPSFSGNYAEPPNYLSPGSLDPTKSNFPVWSTEILNFEATGGAAAHWKYHKIGTAAMMACIPISPSTGFIPEGDKDSDMSRTAQALYTALVPNAKAVSPRLKRKINYAAQNTYFAMAGIDRDGTTGPTYNPYPGYYVTQRDPTTGQVGSVWIPWNPNELGWEDAISVSVWYNFALLPGPAKWLATPLNPPDGTPDKVSSLIEDARNAYRGKVKVVVLSATATVSNEGLKSVMPYAQPAD